MIDAAHTVTLTFASIAVLLRWDVAAVIGMAVLGVLTVAYFLVPNVEDPDPALPLEYAVALRRLRDSGNDKGAVGDLRALYPNLGAAQALRIIRAL